MQSVEQDLSDYEIWLRTQCAVVEAGLRKRRTVMAESPFRFLRATFFRWARTAPEFAGHLASAPLALCVGDAHVENYGTWIDADGRRVWGVNDFDEAAVMPYVLDLIRLLVSAKLAPELALDASQAARAVLGGYRDGLGHPGPVLVEHGDRWFRLLLAGLEDMAGAYWQEFETYKPAEPPDPVRLALLRALPDGAERVSFTRHQKGGGSLGRPRYFAVADWRGGRVAREAKAVVPSAWDWASGTPVPSRGMEIADGTHRAPDASLVRAGSFLVRRLAPDARKLNLQDVAKKGRGVALLKAMAADLAAIHVATAPQGAIRRHLDQQPPGWLSEAAAMAEKRVRSDFRAWKSQQGRAKS